MKKEERRKKIISQTLLNKLVTKELVDDIFGEIVSVNGGWRPSLMPVYIDAVLQKVKIYASPEEEYSTIRKMVIVRLKELDPVLFQRV